MVGRKIFGQIDRRLHQAFPHHAQEVFGGCSLLLFGDFGQKRALLAGNSHSLRWRDESLKAYSAAMVKTALVDSNGQCSSPCEDLGLSP